MTYDPAQYEKRREANERSRLKAHRSEQPWSPAEDAFIMQEWVQAGPKQRDEELVAGIVERTIEACRNRAHLLAGIHLGLHYNKGNERPSIRYAWMDEWERETGGYCSLD